MKKTIVGLLAAASVGLVAFVMYKKKLDPVKMLAEEPVDYYEELPEGQEEYIEPEPIYVPAPSPASMSAPAPSAPAQAPAQAADLPGTDELGLLPSTTAVKKPIKSILNRLGSSLGSGIKQSQIPIDPVTGKTVSSIKPTSTSRLKKPTVKATATTAKVVTTVKPSLASLAGRLKTRTTAKPVVKAIVADNTRMISAAKRSLAADAAWANSLTSDGMDPNLIKW